MSDPPLSDIDFKNKMSWVSTTLNSPARKERIRVIELESFKLESFKLESLKLESFCLSWKEPNDVGKFLLELESFAEIGKCHYTSNFLNSTTIRNLPHNLSKIHWSFQLPLTFSTLIITFQLHWFFPSQFQTFQLPHPLSTSARSFQLCSFQFHVYFSNFQLSNFTIVPTPQSFQLNVSDNRSNRVI